MSSNQLTFHELKTFDGENKAFGNYSVECNSVRNIWFDFGSSRLMKPTILHLLFGVNSGRNQVTYFMGVVKLTSSVHGILMRRIYFWLLTNC